MSSSANYSRRRFLKQAAGLAAATAAAPLVVPASALGLGERAAPSNRVTIGMIGLGRQAILYNLPFFLEADDAQVVAICDVDRYRRELNDDKKITFGKREVRLPQGRMTGCSRHGDFREVLDRKDVDAVMISTPDFWHVPIALRAVQAGKDISCEKPIGLCLKHGRALADAVKNSRVVFRTDSEFRSINVFHRAVTLVRNGRIGKLKTIRTAVPIYDTTRVPIPPTEPVPTDLDYAMWLGPAPEAPYCENRVHPHATYDGRPGWFNISDYCEGMLSNWGYHIHDVAQWGNDSERTGPVEIEGRGEFLPPGDLWNVCIKFDVTYRYANGVQMHFKSQGPGERPPAYVHFEGTEGSVRANYGAKTLETEPKSLADSQIKPDEIQFPFKPEKRDFLDCVKSRGQTMEDAEVGHRGSSIGQLGSIAVRLGRKFRWDPAAERFPDDDEANKRLNYQPGRAPWTVG